MPIVKSVVYVSNPKKIGFWRTQEQKDEFAHHKLHSKTKLKDFDSNLQYYTKDCKIILKQSLDKRKSCNCYKNVFGVILFYNP